MKELKEHLGMWLFLASEVLLFGVLIFLFEVMHLKYPQEFTAGSQELHFLHGTVNTVILLTSSYLLALGLLKRQRFYLLLALVLGAAFMGIKGHEYYGLIHEGKFVLNFGSEITSGKKMFFTFYGFLTMLHMLHVLAGMILLGGLWWMMKHKPDEEIEENVGLYWHFVDLVWVFLYPLFYLLGK